MSWRLGVVHSNLMFTNFFLKLIFFFFGHLIRNRRLFGTVFCFLCGALRRLNELEWGISIDFICAKATFFFSKIMVLCGILNCWFSGTVFASWYGVLMLFILIVHSFIVLSDDIICTNLELVLSFFNFGKMMVICGNLTCWFLGSMFATLYGVLRKLYELEW